MTHETDLPDAQVRFAALVSGCFGATLSVSEPAEPKSPPDAPCADPFGLAGSRELHDANVWPHGQPGVCWSRQFSGWVVSGHADALSVLRDPTFRADEPIRRLEQITLRGGPSLNNLATVLANVTFYTNSPRHEVLRKFTSNILRTFDVAGLRARLDQRASELVSAARRGGTLDLVEGYAADLALFAIHVLLGLPFEDCLGLARTMREVAWIFDVTPHSLREFRQAEMRVGELLDYFERMIALDRAQPGGSGFSLIVQLAGRELALSDRELAGYCTFFFIGGEETTASGIAASTYMLLQRTALRERLRAQQDKLPGATRELLRLAAPFRYVTRIATRDSVLGERTVTSGSRVILMLGAANRDPAAFTNPDEVDPDRVGPDSLAFGHGAYRCLGAGLAQVETEIALAHLLQAPELQLVPGSARWEQRMRVPALARALARFLPAGEQAVQSG